MDSIFSLKKSVSNIFKNHLNKFALYFWQIICPLFFAAFFLRLIEYFYLSYSLPISKSILEPQLTGLVYDIFISFAIMGIFYFPVGLFLYFFAQKLAKYFFSVFTLFYILIQLSLIEYFKSTFTPLDSAILKYTASEIIYITKASLNINIGFLIAIITLSSIFILFTSIQITKVIKVIKPLQFGLLLIIPFSIIFHSKTYPKKHKFHTELNYYLTVNKTFFFLNDLIENKNTPASKSNFTSAEYKVKANNYWNHFPEFEFTNEQYPFLRKNNDNDILGNFFNLNDTAPNFVFIIVESLGKVISGEKAFIGSFTPFLDSLSQESLSWDNFLSNSQRTFGVLPGVLGSLPYGEKGFLELNSEMPPHYSLLSILNKANYFTSFYYGGWMHFDKMDVFLKKNLVNFFIDDFGNYNKIPAQKNSDFSWGYGDKALFNRSLEIKKLQNYDQPFCDVYLTLSMHKPWLTHNQDYYKNKAVERISRLNLSPQNKKLCLNNLDKLSCILYTDDAIKEYFNKISQLPAYKNTIFIITGDHRLEPLPLKSEIDYYHVPLIIYSKMLKKPKRIKGVSSHQNIAPSLIALLKKWEIKTPKKMHCMEGPLDTSSIFQNKQIHAFMRNNKTVDQLIYKNYFLNGDLLYKINDGMTTTYHTDTAIKSEMKLFIDDFNFLNSYACQNKKLVPFVDFVNFQE